MFCANPTRPGFFGRPGAAAPRRSFSLIELLVVTGIVAVLLVAIFSILSGGIRVWERVRAFNQPSVESVLGLESLEKDLHNSFAFYAIRFEGQADRVQFPGLVETRDGATQRRQIGTIKYYYDSQGKSLNRIAWAFPLAEPGSGAAEKMISSLDKAAFSYYYRATNSEYQIKDSWTEDKRLPIGVEVKLDSGGGQDRVEVQRAIYLPGAWAW